MRVYIHVPHPAIAIARTCAALIKYAPPDIEFVTSPKLADLEILNVIGRQDQTFRTAWKARSYAVIQYALRSTMCPDPAAWLPSN